MSATTFSRKIKLATVAAETSASVPALPERRELTAPRRNGYPVKTVTPVATSRPLGPSSGGRANTYRRTPSKASAAPPMTIRSTSALRISDECGARAGINSAATCAASLIAASTEERSQRLGEYHTTTDPVRGYACTARTPSCLATASSTATARRELQRTHST